MEITTDILLKGRTWDRLVTELKNIFANRTNYQIFMLALSIGVMYDKRLVFDDEPGINPRSVPRNVLQNNDNGKLDTIYQAAVLSTLTENYDEEERLELAFGENNNINKIAFLSEFANFGATKLEELIGTSEIETVENIKNYLCSTVEGLNFEIDDLSDEFVFG